MSILPATIFFAALAPYFAVSSLRRSAGSCCACCDWSAPPPCDTNCRQLSTYCETRGSPGPMPCVPMSAGLILYLLCRQFWTAGSMPCQAAWAAPCCSEFSTLPKNPPSPSASEGPQVSMRTKQPVIALCHTGVRDLEFLDVTLYA